MSDDKEYTEPIKNECGGYYCSEEAGHIDCQIPSFVRAAGDCMCSCGKKYYDHKSNQKWPWLTELCGGKLVKL